MSKFKIGFNKPWLSGNELKNISEAAALCQISGDGKFTKQCVDTFATKFGFANSYLMPSCTAALEASALLLNLEPGDEVIVPSYTFVSTANAFALRGAQIVFADSCQDHPNVSVNSIKDLITSKTKAIVPVHYAGSVCAMTEIIALANETGAVVIEDAAQALGANYEGGTAGTFGALASFSFHETKNITCGEGGLLVVNDSQLLHRAAVIRDKGTNRHDFNSGKVDKYTWVDVGSSYTAGELAAAFLAGQIQEFSTITERRIAIWNRYLTQLVAADIHKVWQLASMPAGSTNNGHMFWMVTRNAQERDSFIKWMEAEGIQTLFHYQPLHQSPFGKKYESNFLPNADRYGQCLVRLPLFYELSDESVDIICDAVARFVKTKL